MYTPIGRVWRIGSVLLVMAMCGCKEETASTPDEEQTIQRFRHLYIESDERLPFTARFMGMQIMQNPADMWTIQEIISDVRPDVIIETGTAYGGTATYYATMLQAVQPAGRIISIDIAPKHEEGIASIGNDALRQRVQRLFDERIEVIQSNSVATELLQSLKRKTKDERVLVILDSCHNSQHVLEEMQLYTPLVSPGSYLIVQDTIIDQKQQWIDRYAQCSGYNSAAGPARAVGEFLKQSGDFVVDQNRERYLLTFCPGGFLRKKSGLP